jgi:hypothetical protein
MTTTRTLVQWLPLAAFSLLSLACPGGGGGNTDGGADSGSNQSEFPIITVAGKVFVHPEAKGFLADAGYPELALTGLTVRVEEPLLVALDPSNPSAVFGSRTLDATGNFTVGDVRTEIVTLGIAAGVRDDSDAGLRCCSTCGALADGGCPFVPDTKVVRSATVLYDVTFASGTKPEEDVRGGKAYAIPSEFHAKLNAAVTPTRILQLTGSSQSTLVGAGFVLGRVVDTAGVPVAGLKVSADTTVTDRIFYPSADLSTVGTDGTSSNGLFVYVYNGEAAPSQFPFTIQGRSEYKLRKAGAARGAGLIVTVFPGNTEP